MVEPQQAAEFKDQGMLSRSATRHQGQSSIIDFLSGAGQDAHAGRQDQQQEASDGQSVGEVPDLLEAPRCCFWVSVGHFGQGSLARTLHRGCWKTLHMCLLGCSTEECHVVNCRETLLWCIADNCFLQKGCLTAYWCLGCC